MICVLPVIPSVLARIFFINRKGIQSLGVPVFFLNPKCHQCCSEPVLLQLWKRYKEMKLQFRISIFIPLNLGRKADHKQIVCKSMWWKGNHKEWSLLATECIKTGGIKIYFFWFLNVSFQIPIQTSTKHCFEFYTWKILYIHWFNDIKSSHH